MSRAELEDLREQLSSLRIRVFAQEERIESLEEQVRERGLEDRGLEDRGREARVLDSPEPRGVASLSEAGGVSLGSYSVVPNPRRENCGNNDISSEDTAARLQLAQECGRVFEEGARRRLPRYLRKIEIEVGFKGVPCGCRLRRAGP